MSLSPPHALLTALADAFGRIRSAGNAEQIRAISDEVASTFEGEGEEAAAARAQLAVVTEIALKNAALEARLDSMLRAREVLLASISHDLRNPLNTFAMSAGLLRDDLERNDVDVTRALGLSTRMERATARMQALIEDLLDASRIDAQKLELSPKIERAGQLARDATTAAARLAAERRTNIGTGDLDEDARVSVDRPRTLDALAKVISFSVKSMGDGGTLRLSVQKHERSVVITSAAYPPGATMPPSNEHRDDARGGQDDTRGGLALLIARGLIEAQGGTFRIEGESGLTIVMTLPTVD